MKRHCCLTNSNCILYLRSMRWYCTKLFLVCYFLCKDIAKIADLIMKHSHLQHLWPSPSSQHCQYAVSLPTKIGERQQRYLVEVEMSVLPMNSLLQCNWLTGEQSYISTQFEVRLNDAVIRQCFLSRRRFISLVVRIVFSYFWYCSFRSFALVQLDWIPGSAEALPCKRFFFRSELIRPRGIFDNIPENIKTVGSRIAAYTAGGEDIKGLQSCQLACGVPELNSYHFSTCMTKGHRNYPESPRLSVWF